MTQRDPAFDSPKLQCSESPFQYRQTENALLCKVKAFDG